MRARLTAAFVCAVLVATACGAKGSDNATTTSGAGNASTTAASSGGSSDTKFGTLPSPCGKGNATVKADQAGGSPDKLRIGVANDRTSIRSGLLKELWDGTNGFVAWCNAQGGIDGVQLEAVDLDGKLFEIEQAMAKACTGVFALVGGGYAQDNLIFTGKEGSDFHKCKLIAIPGFAVSTEYSEASDVVQAIPNPPNVKSLSHFEGLKELYPEKIKHYGVVYGNLPSIAQNKDQTLATVKAVGGYEGLDVIPTDPVNQDWSVISQQVIDKKLELVSYIGEPTGLSKLSQALKDQNWDGILTADANQYDSRLLQVSGPEAVDGVTVRSVIHPLEEADKWPAIKQFAEIMDKNVPQWEHAVLAIQAFSSSLLFATAAKACADKGEITRECVLTEAQAVHKWDGGGLHSPGDPGKNGPPACSMIVQVKAGAWTRLYPKLGSKADDGDGFHCGKVVDIPGDFGKGNRDSSILGG